MNKLLVLLVCFLLPVLLLALLMRKKRSVLLMFCLGMLAFFLSQMVLRIPLLQLLQRQLSFSMFTLSSPVLYLLFLAFTAGVFEEVARFLCFRSTRKRHDELWDALAFGLGHGGIEAMLLVGIPLLQFDVSMNNVVVACFERVTTIALHVALSIIVWKGVQKHQLRYLFIAIFLHMGVNSLTGLPFGILGIELLIFLATLVIWWGVIAKLLKRGDYNETMSSIHEV